MKPNLNTLLIIAAIIFTVLGLTLFYTQNWKDAAGCWCLSAICLWSFIAKNECKYIDD